MCGRVGRDVATCAPIAGAATLVAWTRGAAHRPGGVRSPPHARSPRRTYSEYRGRSARNLLAWTRGAVHRRAVSSPATGTTPQTNVQRISWPVGSYPIGLDARRGAPQGGVQPCHRHDPSDERTANIVAGRLVPYWPGREARCTAGRCPALPQARPLRRTYSEYRGRSARTLLAWTRGAVHRRAVSSPATGTTPQTNVQRISWPVGSYPIGLDARRGAPPGGVQPCHRHDPSDERTANIVAGRLVPYWPGREARCTAGRCPALPQARALRRTYSEYRGRSARTLLAWTRGAVHRRAVSSPATGTTPRRTYSEYRGRTARPRPACLPARRPGRDRTHRPSAGASGSPTSARSPRRAATFARVPRSPRR